GRRGLRVHGVTTMKAFKTLALATALTAALSGAAAQAAVPPLRLCADPANLPFSSAADAAVPGLYVEIGRAVADALGRPMETVWSLSYFGKRNLRATLLAGQCDLAVGLPATADFMGPRVIFTQPILELGYALVLPKGRSAARIDDLVGRRVIVQFGSPPQGLLAMRSDITTITAMDPEEAMRRLAAGEADAAFIWGPSAAYINRTALHDAFDVVAVNAPQMQWPAAIGVSSRQAQLRDDVNAVLEGLQPRIRELAAKYALDAGPAIVLADASATPLAVAQAATPVAVVQPAAAPARSDKGDAVMGKQVFDSTCAHCHGPNAVVADRKINLRLLKRKHGEQLDEVFFTTVTEGRPSMGMPAWKDVFKRQDFANILSYLKTVQEP
ncbi:MAG TPA: transporter substrate-binding domain-containing protein, partial [Burkholderiaceae bacterium]|nr:transporter substrate-binding domain-containing protein [Burkholderiaceae bacterium]